jgi:hypothetical protein
VRRETAVGFFQEPDPEAAGDGVVDKRRSWWARHLSLPFYASEASCWR